MKYSANDILKIMKVAKNYNNFLLNNIYSLLTEYKYENILDFGCADGFFIKNIKLTNKNLFGIETDENSLKICKQNGLNVKKYINEFSNKFDLIYTFNVLEHIENDVEILKTFYDKLNRNGRILIYVPACQFLYSSMDKKVGHYRRYQKKDLINKIKKVGFDIEKVEYCDSIGILATILYIIKDKILKNNNGDITSFQIKLYDYIFPISRFLDKILFKTYIGKNLILIGTKN